MEDKNSNPLIKKDNSLAKFDPKKKKGLIVRGLRETIRQKTILLVEGEKGIQKLYCAELHNAFGGKIKIISFYDGKPAYEFLKENLDKVDLIISCILMPEMHGIQLLRVCKELKPNLPFIINSAYDYRGDLSVWVSDEYLVKSADISDLLAVIRVYLFPDDVSMHNLFAFGSVQLGQKRYKEATKIYARILEIEPDYAEAYNNIGFAYKNLGMYSEAMAAFKQAIKIKSDYADAHYNLGITYLNIKEKNKALEQYQILKKLEPDYAETLFDEIYR